MCYAIPYQQLLQNVTLNTGVQQKSPLPIPYQYYTDQFWHYDTNVQKAKELLAAAGYPSGALYDGSWAEWGGRSDTPVDT